MIPNNITLDRKPAMGNAESGAGFVRVLTCTLEWCLVPQHAGHLATVCFTIPTSSVRPNVVHGCRHVHSSRANAAMTHSDLCAPGCLGGEHCPVHCGVRGTPREFCQSPIPLSITAVQRPWVIRIISAGNMLSKLPLEESLMPIENQLTH